jgi:transitional endoplasmic reticulum ATPase
MIDAALMRPGRFDHVIHVPTPTMEGRLEILEIFTKDMPISSDLNLHVLAKTTEGYTGSDLKGICREAALVCIREAVPIGEQPMDYENLKIQQKHFEKALSESIPTLSQEMREEYSSTKIVFNR